MLIQTDLVTLRPLNENDAQEFYLWSLDREVTKYSISSYAYPQSPSDITKWLASINASNKIVSLGICCPQSNKLIGYAGITSISALNRCGEYFILIGDKSYWGKGIATEVTKLITEYGIKTLGLNRVELTAFSENPAAVKAYEKAGYQHEGVLRQAGFRDGQFYDKVMMAVLAQDWI
ncbi:MAG: GNAT family N-acetyltransferase [Psychrobium sp.]